MPITPLHLGPGLAAGFPFKRWLDLPVLLLANLVVDVEVPIAASLKTGPLPVRYGHTLLVAAAAGLLTGLFSYPIRGLFRRIMHRIRLPYDTGLRRMLLSGVLGAWLHVLFDGFYRTNVVLFWPSRFPNPLCRFDKTDVETACWILFLIGGAAFAFFALSRKDSSPSKPRDEEPNRTVGNPGIRC